MESLPTADTNIYWGVALYLLSTPISTPVNIIQTVALPGYRATNFRLVRLSWFHFLPSKQFNGSDTREAAKR